MLATTSTWAIRVNFDNKTMCIRLKKKVHLQQDEK